MMMLETVVETKKCLIHVEKVKAKLKIRVPFAHVRFRIFLVRDVFIFFNVTTMRQTPLDLVTFFLPEESEIAAAPFLCRDGYELIIRVLNANGHVSRLFQV